MSNRNDKTCPNGSDLHRARMQPKTNIVISNTYGEPSPELETSRLAKQLLRQL